MFLGYLAIFLLLIRRWRYFSRSGIGRRWLTIIFLVKSTAAVLYGIYHFNAGGSDTFSMFEDGRLFARQLPEHPVQYLKLVFGPGQGPIPDDIRPVLVESLGYWGNTGNYMVVRFHALAGILSFGFYNVHALFMAFLSLIGLTGIYRFIIAHSGNALGPGAAIVLALPSVLFYGSGLHKEGLLILCIGVLLWNLYRLLAGKWLSLLPVALSLTLMFLLKNFYFAAILPCLMAFVWVSRQPRLALIKYVATVVVLWALFFSAGQFSSFDIGRTLALKQAEFRVLQQGDAHVYIEPLDGTEMSVLAAVPTAMLNVFLQPLPDNIGKPVHAAYALEQLFVLLLVAAALIWRKKERSMLNPVLLLLFFSITVFVIIGLIVPNYGAISRYKAPALLCFVSALVMLIDWKRMGSFKFKV